MMDIEQLIRSASSSVVILGAMPFTDMLLAGAPALVERMSKKQDLSASVFYESDQALFYQSLISDRPGEASPTYLELRRKHERIAALNLAQPSHRLTIKQLNVPLPFYAVAVDSRIYVCPVGRSIPIPSQYERVRATTPWKQHVESYIDFLQSDSWGRTLLSTADDEMLVLYDRSETGSPPTPRGTLPRDAFIDTRFERYSVWLFVFNRQGRLLLHRRPPHARDNRGLWDKSAGGHVDLSDTSTAYTAARELAEELLIQHGERAPVGAKPPSMINLGTWLPEKRGQEAIFDDLRFFDENDWGFFQLSQHDRAPRVSRRKTFDEATKQEAWTETRFISDVFFVVAPRDTIEDEGQIRKNLAGNVEFKLETVPQLRDSIARAQGARGATGADERDEFTDDLLWMMRERHQTLERFALLVRDAKLG